ncbi:MAG: FHA domain-containing protein [Planctomycetes bacterium]|nr:FHA domain-containing protein [Planctomycetota bacterium]
MVTDPSLLALRHLDQDYALEPGRDYLLGAAADCDLRISGQNVAPHHARLRASESGAELVDLGSEIGTYRNGERVACAHLEVGDALQLGDGAVVVTRDAGQAAILPIPAMVADAAARRRRVAAPNPGVRRFEEIGFTDLVADELRHAPWLAVSAILHAALFLLLLFLFPTRQPSGDARVTVDLDLSASRVTDGEASVETPEVVTEEVEVPLDIDEPVAPPEVVEAPPPEKEAPGEMTTNPRLAKRPPAPKSEAEQTTNRRGDVTGVGSAGFKQTVAELQKSGLEIVFVFDSTGSMGETIRDTKNTIAEMLQMLRALVPDARVGLVTYRDRGRDEDYVVRQIPLGLDFWQASNFVQNVQADGGGDRPEAVRDGLRAAFTQDWGATSRRVVVLAGDAPPHQRDRSDLGELVRGFASRGNSFVYALVTSPRDAGEDTHEEFRRIAQLGKGECLPLDSHEEVLRRVLDFAFGQQFDGDLAKVRAFLRDNADRTETWALDLSRRGGSDLEVALRRKPVDAALLHALVRLPKRPVIEQLVRTLAYPTTPPHTRQAIAWVLQRVFDLSTPPVDPITGEPVSERGISYLTNLARRLPE